MPRIVDQREYDGAATRIARLGLTPLWNELLAIPAGFQFLIEEARHANSAATMREMMDAEFARHPGWSKITSGGVDWSKCVTINGVRVCLSVEVQCSGRSDLLIVDVSHLRDRIIAGETDVGVIIVPSDRLAPYLTDRCPHFTAALTAIERARAQDLPLVVVAIEHDGVGPALEKRTTNLGTGKRKGKLGQPPSN